MKYLYGLLCLIFLILFHETGHFIFAKLFGVEVETFSIGFGPVLLKKKIKGTEYRISAIPLGGYCGMKGENEFRKAVEENLNEIPSGPDCLYGTHPLKRALIGFGGPFFNFILAIIFNSIIALIGYNYFTYSNKIIISDEVIEEVHSSAAKKAGLITGDKIIKIQNKEITNFNDLHWEISTRPDEDIQVTVDRNGEILIFNVHTDFDKETGSGRIGISVDTNEIVEYQSPKYNIFTAVGKGTKDTIDFIGVTFKGFKVLFKGIDIKNSVSGPIRATELLGSSIENSSGVEAKYALINTLELMAIISISLFIMNLLPVPVLDGGLILFAIIEWITHKKIKPKIQYYIQFVGIAFILVLFAIAMTSDISYFVNKGK